MTIKIGEQALATRRPTNLDEQLVASTGCSAAELAAQLQAGGTGFHVARAVAPFLDKGAPALGDLAGMIGDDHLPELRRQVIALLAPEAPAKVEKA